MDEKGFLMGLASKARVICRQGRKNPRYTNGLLVTKEEIDQLKLEIEEKEALVAAKQLRVEEKKSCQSRKQLVIPKARKQKKVSFASIASIEFHILTNTG